MQLIKTAEYKKYVIKKEMVSPPGSKPFEMTSAYAHTGCYLGPPEEADRLFDKIDVDPNSLDGSHSNNVCTLGFCPSEKKWYGWSHRAINGFGVGDMPTASTPMGNETKHSGPAKSLDDAKKYAIEFADSVG
jgi:hypothetical protein